MSEGSNVSNNQRLLMTSLALTFGLTPTVYALLRVAMVKIAPEISPLAVLSTERSTFVDRCSLTGYVMLLFFVSFIGLAKKFPDKMQRVFIGFVGMSSLTSLLQGALVP